jgi:hypothetical protein
VWDKQQNHNSDLGPTCGERFSLPFRTVFSQREQDDTIGDKQKGKDYNADRPTTSYHQEGKDVSVSACQLQ